MPKLGARDREFIETRLLASSTSNLTEAIVRLRRLGFDDEADRLQKALNEFNEAVCTVRLEIMYELTNG